MSIDTQLEYIRAEYAKTLEDGLACIARNVTLAQENEALKARIAELEAVDSPATPPAPTTKPPAILNESFRNGVDWARFFSDGNPSAPRDRFQPVPDGLKVVWIAGSPSGTTRSEIGIRATAGGGDTARRFAIGSELWLRYDFMLPTGYKLDDAEADHKRVLCQLHQVSGEPPPLSLELRNGSLRLVRAVSGEHEDVLRVPASKGSWSRLLLHVKLHPTDGWIEAWLDALTKPRYSCKTCLSASEGPQAKMGSYQPGAKNGDFPSGYRIEHLVRRWSIGSKDNTHAEMLA